MTSVPLDQSAKTIARLENRRRSIATYVLLTISFFVLRAIVKAVLDFSWGVLVVLSLCLVLARWANVEGFGQLQIGHAFIHELGKSIRHRIQTYRNPKMNLNGNGHALDHSTVQGTTMGSSKPPAPDPDIVRRDVDPRI